MALEFTGVHADFLADQTTEIDLEGARSSGKTWVVCAKIIRSCQAHAGIEWLFCRYSGEETKNKLKPEFIRLCALHDEYPKWDDKSSCYLFENGSKVFMYGLKTQDRLAFFAKIRGLGVACVAVDQTEELPEPIALELRAVMRQPGYPHQLIFSPNPCDEDHWLADQFPEDQSIPNRKFYRVSLYDNVQNLDPKTISGFEQAYPITHAKHKSLILGMRGPNVTGTPVYDGVFDRNLHVGPVAFDPSSVLLEAYDAGKHHPTWLAAQRTPFGGLRILGGIIGKRLFLEDFLPLVQRYRSEWFTDDGATAIESRVCCDPPLSAEKGLRYTTVNILNAAKLKPRWRENANAPDVRGTVIEHLGALMQRRAGNSQAFLITNNPTRWLMASQAVVKQTKLLVDGLEGSYVWSSNYVSVGNKLVRQAQFDQWLDGWQRCLENLVLNFLAGQLSQAERDALTKKARDGGRGSGFLDTPTGWMAF